MFKVGDRCVVYSAQIFNTPAKNFGPPAGNAWGPFSGEVVRTNEVWGTQKGFISVMAPWGVEIKAHPKQCRLLRPKKKPVEFKRVERWVNVYTDHRAADVFFSECAAKRSKERCANYVCTAHLVELKESEIIVSYADLAKAYTQAFGLSDTERAKTRELFIALCAALGIKAENEGGK